MSVTRRVRVRVKDTGRARVITRDTMWFGVTRKVSGRLPGSLRASLLLLQNMASDRLC